MGYRGYIENDILHADNKLELQRSENLRSIKTAVLERFWADVSYYRELATQLLKYHKTNAPEYWGTICDNVHTNISLKHNHIYNDIYNDMAHLWLF